MRQIGQTVFDANGNRYVVIRHMSLERYEEFKDALSDKSANVLGRYWQGSHSGALFLEPIIEAEHVELDKPPRPTKYPRVQKVVDVSLKEFEKNQQQ